MKQKQFSTGTLSGFFEQMYMFLQSGITIWESLSIMSENVTNKKEAKVYADMYDLVLDGHSLSSAMEEVCVFPTYAIGMCKIGEEAGRMDDTANSLKTYYAEKDALAQSIKSAVMYPLCMALMVLSVIFVLIIQVMPVFEQVFSQLGLELNPFATTLLGVGETLNTYALTILISILVFGIFIAIFKKTSYGKKCISNFFHILPLTKKLSEAREANSFAFSTSLMLASGMETLTAFDFAKGLAESSSARKKIEKMSDILIDGHTLSQALIDSDIFSEGYNSMIIAGNRVGSTDEMLMSIAKRYHDETEERTRKLIGIIEPSLVAVLCTMVGLVMLSVMLPLMGILSGMQG